MALDPLTALSLAGTIVQFVDFSAKILKTTYQLYKTGEELSTNDEIELVTKDLQRWISRLRPHNSEPLTEDEQGFDRLCKASIDIAENLSQHLESVKGRKWNLDQYKRRFSVAKALRTVWAEKDIQNLERRLSRLRNEVEMRILVDLREKLSIQTIRQSVRFNDLDEKTQTILETLLQHQSVVSDEIRKYTLHISKQFERNEQVAADRHRRAQAHISEMFKERLGDEAFNTTYRRVPEWALLKTFGVEEQRLVRSVEDAILESLKFPSMTYRYEGVSESHNRTFEWIYQENAEASHHWSDFVKWLRHGHGPYWVNGKAGSGKSTLMKYIYENPKTEQELLIWAGDETLTILSFFFWNSGTPDQRSQSGLLRSILYDVLSIHRRLIPIVLPRYWAWKYSQAIYPSTRKRGSLSTSHLLQAFKLLVEQTTFPVKACLLIDGLDEYDGNHSDLAEVFLNLTVSPNIKICVSSRPLLIFEESFGNAPGLRLQDLTYPDITRYVRDNLEDNKRFRLLKQKEPQRAPQLIQEIVTKADGVFLWVCLVVRSLLEGLGNRDRISDLQRRLNMLPADLEALYAHMLWKRVDKSYLQDASEILQLARAAHDENQHTFNTADDEELPFTLMQLLFAQPEDAGMFYADKLRFMANDEYLEECQRVGDRVTSRCAGLLEVQDTALFPADMGRLQYLHRTVKDYLEKEEVWNSVISYTSNTDFSPNLSLLQSSFLQLKSEQIICSNISRLAASAMFHARETELACQNPRSDLVDELDHIMKVYHANIDFPPRQGKYRLRLPGLEDCQDSFLTYAIEQGLCGYVHGKLEQGDGVFEVRKGRPFLEYAIHPHINHKMIKILLAHGANPSIKFQNSTAWQKFLKLILQLNTDGTSTSQSKPALREILASLKLLTESSAIDVNAKVEHEGQLWSALSIIRFKLSRLQGVEAIQAAGWIRMLQSQGAVESIAETLPRPYHAALAEEIV